MNALGIYLLVSLFFVIATMMEFAIVLMIARARGGTDNATSQRKRKTMRMNSANTKKQWFLNRVIPNTPENDEKNFYSFTEKIDFKALFVFMLMYFMFNYFYFAHYF